MFKFLKIQLPEVKIVSRGSRIKHFVDPPIQKQIAFWGVGGAQRAKEHQNGSSVNSALFVHQRNNFDQKRQIERQ